MRCGVSKLEKEKKCRRQFKSLMIERKEIGCNLRQPSTFNFQPSTLHYLCITFAAMKDAIPTPNYLWSIFTMKCPRCRRGPMFKDANAYRKLKLSHIFDMPEHCPECGQRYDLEQGFWYGTGYVSYALAVAISVSTFVAWWVLIGVSTDDNRIFWWLGLNALLLVLIQPWMMRLSRVIYLYFFVSYDNEYKKTAPTEFDHKQ
jgi:uncharacterized protein (DUF983 family)